MQHLAQAEFDIKMQKQQAELNFRAAKLQMDTAEAERRVQIVEEEFINLELLSNKSTSSAKKNYALNQPPTSIHLEPTTDCNIADVTPLAPVASNSTLNPQAPSSDCY